MRSVGRRQDSGCCASHRQNAPWTYPILILNDVLPDRGQRGPLAVTGCTYSTPFVSLKFAHYGKRNTQPYKFHPQQEPPCGADGCLVKLGWNEEILMDILGAAIHNSRVWLETVGTVG